MCDRISNHIWPKPDLAEARFYKSYIFSVLIKELLVFQVKIFKILSSIFQIWINIINFGI